jgi:hypothetical protein
MKPAVSVQKAIVFDSGTLINFAMNGLFEEFKELKQMFNGKFLITKEVKGEIIDRPITIKRFELEALKLQELLEENVLEMPSAFGIDETKISQMTKQFLDVSNNTFFGKENAIHIIDLGEASCIALSKLLDEKNIKNVISVDERTIRVLCEKPENLLALLQKKLHTEITAKKENFKFFQGYRFIRSAEFMYLLYKKGIIKLKNHNVLDALLYAVKFKGCSITDEEISQMEKL